MDECKGYRLIDPIAHKIVVSREVVFMEPRNLGNLDSNNKDSQFLFTDENTNSSVVENWHNDNYVSDVSLEELTNTVIVLDSTTDADQSQKDERGEDTISVSTDNISGLNDSGSSDEFYTDDSRISDPDFIPNESELLADESLLVLQDQNTFSHFDAFSFFVNEVTNKNEPTTVKQALSCEDKANWLAAMNEEYKSLISNNTWKLVDLPPNRKAINNKWVLKIKLDVNGKCIRYKARLVAKGCSQRAGVDYDETFSPVVKNLTIRFLLTLSVEYYLETEQMDAVTAVLQGDVSEKIYM